MTNRHSAFKLLPEELITFAFTVIILSLKLALYFLGKVSDISDLLTPLLLFFAYFLFIFIFCKNQNKIIIFIRTYFHIPYYGVLFTAFQSYLHKLNPKDWDLFLLKGDYFLFGFDITVWLERFNNNLLSEILIIFYFSYYLLPTVFAFIIFFHNTSNDSYYKLRTFILTIVITWYSAFVFYALMPAAGPDITFPQHYKTELMGISLFTNYYFETVTSYLRESEVRNTFPSLHFGILLIISYFAFKWKRKFFYFCSLPCTTGLAIATVYLRQHYLIDLFGVIPLVIFSIYISQLIKKGKTT